MAQRKLHAFEPVTGPGGHPHAGTCRRCGGVRSHSLHALPPAAKRPGLTFQAGDHVVYKGWTERHGWTGVVVYARWDVNGRTSYESVSVDYSEMGSKATYYERAEHLRFAPVAPTFCSAEEAEAWLEEQVAKREADDLRAAEQASPLGRVIVQVSDTDAGLTVEYSDGYTVEFADGIPDEQTARDIAVFHGVLAPRPNNTIIPDLIVGDLRVGDILVTSTSNSTSITVNTTNFDWRTA